MLLDNKYAIVPQIRFTLIYDNNIRKVITVKTKDTITCSYKKNGEKYSITGVVAKIGCNFNSSLGAVGTTAYLQVDGSSEYAGQVEYINPSQVLDLVIISTTDSIVDVVCSVDNDDQRICLIRENEVGVFQYSLDGITWRAAKGSQGMSAYECAVALGFEGSEEEWLESLKGKAGEPGEPGALEIYKVFTSIDEAERNRDLIPKGKLVAVTMDPDSVLFVRNGEENAGIYVTVTDTSNAVTAKGYDYLGYLNVGPTGPKGDAGQNGVDGKSAYTYAVEGGFPGTEAEFTQVLGRSAVAVMNYFMGPSPVLTNTVIGPIDLRIFGYTDPTSFVSKTIRAVGITSSTADDQILKFPEGIILRAVPTEREAAKPNVVIRGRKYVADCIMKKDGQVGVLRRIKYIESYTGETIIGDWMSSTGKLDLGAKVQYVTYGEFEPFTETVQAQYTKLHSCDNDISIKTTDGTYMSVAYPIDVKTYIEQYTAQKVQEALVEKAPEVITPIVEQKIAEKLVTKQDKLTAGANITIDENNVISATSGSIKNPYNYIKQVADYLFETQYSTGNIDYAYANNYFKNAPASELSFGQFCSGVYNNGRVLRQFDFFYNNLAEFIVRRPADPENNVHGSIGIATGVKGLTKDIVESGSYDAKFKLLPFTLSDGINDAGLYGQINVVQPLETGFDLNPTASTECCILMALRYILDYCSTLDDVENFFNTVHIYGTSELSFGYHFLFVKDNTWRVVEITQSGHINVTSGTGINQMPHGIMTNFRTNGLTFTNDNVDWSSVESYGLGVERYDLITKAFTEGTTFETLRSELKYTNLYTNLQTNTRWNTEYCGDPGRTISKLTVMDAKNSPSEFDTLFASYAIKYANRDRAMANPETWQTTHSCIYNITDKSFNITIQERFDEVFNFSLVEKSGGEAYTAGENIQISADNVISATDTKYTPGTNVTIDENNKISATDTKYTPGTNITIDENNVISATGGTGAITEAFTTTIAVGGLAVGTTIAAGTTFEALFKSMLAPYVPPEESKVYCGVTDNAPTSLAGLTGTAIDEATVIASGYTNRYTAENQHFVYAYKKSMGELISIKDPSGFENIDGWTHIEYTESDKTYYIYYTNEKLTVSSYKMKFIYVD